MIAHQLHLHRRGEGRRGIGHNFQLGALAHQLQLHQNGHLLIAANGVFDLFGVGPLNLGAAAHTMTVDSAVTLPGVISNGGFTKAGDGTLTISSSAANTYAGATTITAGMIATGGSAAQAIRVVRDHGATDVRLVAIVSAPEGVAEVERQHPGTVIYTAALDRGLNDRKYILPGLGDFGDRLYGT